VIVRTFFAPSKQTRNVQGPHFFKHKTGTYFKKETPIQICVVLQLGRKMFSAMHNVAQAAALCGNGKAAGSTIRALDEPRAVMSGRPS
jgi:hypothetical protein